MWSFVSTWAFSEQAAKAAAEVLSRGGRAIDAAVAGIKVVESDPCVDCVGRGGFLNAEGALQLDAAIMDGDTLRMGAVAAVSGFEHPIDIARAVMENTRHSMLVGAGAEAFARDMGIPDAQESWLVTEAARERFSKDKEANRLAGHDTIGVVALDGNGTIVAATSTSGASMKLNGRVGDSPIIGSGFYAESGAGGATATGWGEDIMRTICSYRAVELMRAGISPTHAAETVVKTAHEAIRGRGGKPDCIALVCMNTKGECGGAANHKGFWYAYAREGVETRVVEVHPIIDKDGEARA